MIKLTWYSPLHKDLNQIVYLDEAKISAVKAHPTDMTITYIHMTGEDEVWQVKESVEVVLNKIESKKNE